MKEYFKILSFLGLLFLLTAEDCGNGRAPMSVEEKSTGLYQNLENEFLIEELTPKELVAFEKIAIQKLSDLADYLSIYADSSLSPEFRIQAGNMIREIFYSEEDLQNYLNTFSYVEDTSKHLLFSKSEGVKTSVDSIQITESIVNKGNSKYEGSIRFSQAIHFERSIQPEIHFYNQRMKIIVVKTEKYFGEKALRVWTVYLGE